MRCKTCGWLTSDIDGHMDAMYEDHIGDDPVEAWRDRDGDVWVLGDDGMLHARETDAFAREHVEKKWGPLVPIDVEPDWYDTHCPTCDAPEPTHTPTCAVVHVNVEVGSQP